MPTIDGISEKFELFEYLFQTNLKIRNQRTEEDKMSHFLSLMHGDALETFKHISIPSRKNLAEILIVFHIKNVKLQSMAAVKTKTSSTTSLQSSEPEVF